MYNGLILLFQSQILENLDEDRFCSLWYGMDVATHKRHDSRFSSLFFAKFYVMIFCITKVVVPSNRPEAEALYMIISGECVIYQSMKINRPGVPKKLRATDVDLDIKLGTLIPGALFFTEPIWNGFYLVAGTNDVQVLELKLLENENNVHRILGTRVLAAVRKVMRTTMAWRYNQTEVVPATMILNI